MIFSETKLEGAYIIDLERLKDERGFFARAWCRKEFEDHGLTPRLAQANVSRSTKKGTLRGMHYQIAPYQEAKLLRCTNGAVYDVIIDLRPGSPTYTQWVGVELTAKNYKMFYVPEGFAHGFVTLQNDTEVTYLVSQFYTPGSERGIRWDDPRLGIKLPGALACINPRDAAYPDLDSDAFAVFGEIA